MARIKDTSVDAVKAAADIVAVVEERTSLRKQGARLVGRCPFHEERTPSFSVNPSQGLYYCFGCHKGGDLIAFVHSKPRPNTQATGAAQGGDMGRSAA